VYDKISLNAGIYHLYTTDVMESVAYYSNGVTISTRANAGTNHKTGIELNGKYTPLKWMSLTADFNYGYFNRQGSFNNRSFDFRGEQWSARSTIKLKLPAKTDLELTPNYQSSYKTVLGTVSGFLTIDAGVRKKILKDKAVINFSVRDIFASRIMETIIVQPDYSVYSFGKRGRFLTLGFSYSFGKGEVMTYSGGKGGR
jgi:outer membrane receptor protein involved in Fe transport